MTMKIQISETKPNKKCSTKYKDSHTLLHSCTFILEVVHFLPFAVRRSNNVSFATLLLLLWGERETFRLLRFITVFKSVSPYMS